MEEVKIGRKEMEEAKLEMWDYAFGFTPMAVLKCAIQLQIADVIDCHGGEITLSQLSSAVACSPDVLARIMRYLIHRRFFKHVLPLTPSPPSSISYAQTPLSRLLLKDDKDSIAGLLVLESSPAMIDPWHLLRSRALQNDETTPFEAAHGLSLWDYNSANPAQSKLFNEGMACMARQSVADIIEQYPEAFQGMGSLVDVGGGDGSFLRALIKACPWIHGIILDLPHVAKSRHDDDDGIVIEYVGGDMFEAVPKADAAFLMRVLHDWSDEECIEILKKCKEAIPKEGGKVMIAEAVIGKLGEEEEDEYCGLGLTVDMVMLVHTQKGRERSVEEWGFVLSSAGFTTFTVKHLRSIVSLIEAFP